VLRLMPLLRDVVVDPDDKSFLENAFVKLRRVLRRSGGYFLRVVGEVLEGVRGPQTASEKLFMEVYARVHELLKDEAVVEGLVKHPEVGVVREGGALYESVKEVAALLEEAKLELISLLSALGHSVDSVREAVDMKLAEVV